MAEQIKVKKIKLERDQVGTFLKSNAVKQLLHSEANKLDSTKEIRTKHGYIYTGIKKVKDIMTDRAGVYVNYRLNGSALTEALLNSPDRRSRVLGHIRERKN